MEKVIIVGCPGAGKTTFAVALGAKLHIPVHHLDAHFGLKVGHRDLKKNLGKSKQN